MGLAMEQANQMAAAGAFGIAYTLLCKRVPALPAWGLGTLYGSDSTSSTSSVLLLLSV
jgi:hypothetical protein